MADLTDLTAATTVKLVGASLTGTEGAAVNSTADGRLLVDSATTYVSHVNRVDVASAARTTTGTSSTLDSAGFGVISFQISTTAISGTSAAFQISFDVSEDGSVWTELIKTVRFTAISDYRFQRASLSAKYYRFRWTITGTTPSITFSVTSTLKPYMVERNVVVSNYADLNMAVDGSVSSTFLAADSNNISIMTIRAADGGNNGQFKVQASNDAVNWADISGNITQGAGTTILTAFNSQSFRYYRLSLNAKTSAGTRVLDIHWGAS